MNARSNLFGANDGESPFAMRWATRAGLIMAGVVSLGLLATAASLSPDGRGYGTHQQLGLPPCTFEVLAGLRCPSCGMTTAWSCLMRGRVTQAAAANAGGLLLGIAAITAGPWALLSGLCGRWLWRRPSEFVVAAIMAGIVGVTLIDWCLRIGRGW